MLKFASYNEGNETVLKNFEDYWMRGDSVNKLGTDFERRFGSSWALDRLRIRVIPDHEITSLELGAGKIDLARILPFLDDYEDFLG